MTVRFGYGKQKNNDYLLRAVNLDGASKGKTKSFALGINLDDPKIKKEFDSRFFIERVRNLSKKVPPIDPSIGVVLI